MFSQKKLADTILGKLSNGTLTDTFFCEFLHKGLSQFGIPIPSVNFQDVLSGLKKSFIHKITVNNQSTKMTKSTINVSKETNSYL